MAEEDSTKSPLRVTMPLLTLVPGHMGGSETYVRGLLEGLARRDDVEVTVVVPPVAVGMFPGVREVVVDGIASDPSVRGRLATIARAGRPREAVRRATNEADVVHHALTVPVPKAARKPWVVTLLDVQHRDLPAMFTQAERFYRRLAYDRTARRADRVITISNFCRERIVDRLGIAAGVIDVAHLGIAEEWFQAPPVRRGDFVYYPAAAWPHKNHCQLIEAMELVRESRPSLRLVLTGQNPGRLGDLPHWVEHRGQVDRAQVRELYSRAACLAFPSLYEGFGFPSLEAMAASCPVTAARAGAIPEVCGEGTPLFDPDDAGSIAAGILTALETRPEAIAKGLARAREFTWDACAAVHAQSYRSALVGT